MEYKYVWAQILDIQYIQVHALFTSPTSKLAHCFLSQNYGYIPLLTEKGLRSLFDIFPYLSHQYELLNMEVITRY